MVNNAAVSTGVYVSFQTVFSFRYMLRKGIAGSYSSSVLAFFLFNTVLHSGYCCSVAKSCLTLCDPVDYNTPGLSFLCYLPEIAQFMSIELVILSNHLIVCCPLLLHLVFPSIRVFSNESALRIWWPKYWSFSFNISPFSEYLGLNSFGIDWFDLLAVQGTLKP